MSYHATVCKVMIACPSDIKEERDIAHEVIWNWNYLHSERTKIVLLPVGWETHSAPAMGNRPQAIINKQVLEGCDLLIAIFWTRLGTPTGQEDSGTVEEIREHVKRGKPAMLYFSSAPVHPDSLEPEQYERLKAFRNECEGKGLIATYSDSPEFKNLLDSHLIRTVDDHDYFKKIINESTDSGILESTADAGPQQHLSKEARELLLEAVQDRSGCVLRIMTSGGLIIQANKKNVVTAPKDARCQALWQGVLEELVEADLLKDPGYKGEVFRVTRKGYEIADLLKADG